MVDTDINKDYINFLPAPNSSITDIVYPIGSIYMSTVNINPSTLFGGTWVRWGQGKVPISLDENNSNFNTVEKTGGASTHTHTVAAHNHTIDGHTHYIDHHHTAPSHTHTGASHSHSINNHSHSTQDCVLNVNQIPAHEHMLYSFGYNGEHTTANHWQVGFGSVGLRDNIKTRPTGGSRAHNHGWTGGTGTLYTNAEGSGSTGAGGNAATSGASSAFSGNSGTLSSNNNAQQTSSSSSNLPPYITCYMWKRTE